MNYPSEDLNKWFRELSDFLSTVFSEETAERFCQCGVYKIREEMPSEEAASDFFNGLFWSLWVDQTMHYVLVGRGSGSSGLNSEEAKELYSSFRSVYPFVKMESHGSPGMASPGWLLRDFSQPSPAQLKDGKEDFWGNVSSWLKSQNKEGVVSACEKAFKEDLEERVFPKGIGLEPLFE